MDAKVGDESRGHQCKMRKKVQTDARPPTYLEKATCEKTKWWKIASAALRARQRGGRPAGCRARLRYR